MSIRVGLIDSGINIDHSLIHQKSCIINGWKGNYNDFNDTIGHGTQCAHLILKILEKHISEIEIYIVKVFDKHLKTSSKIILEAIHWCIDNNIKVINLSISISDINYYYEFKKVCDEAYNNGIIIVAAADNIGCPCFPAYLNNVIGVGVANFENETDFYYMDSPIQIYSNGNSPKLDINQPNVQATSFATARMTGEIVNILLKNQEKEFNQLVKILSAESLPYKKEKNLRKAPKIDLGKYTIPISLNQNSDVKSIIKELKDIPAQHIVKNQLLNLALINLTNNYPNMLDIENKIMGELMKRNHTIISISPDFQPDVSFYAYSYGIYKQMSGKLHPAYAKALIETVNNNHPNAELIIIRMDQPIVPLNISNSLFSDIYTIPEISLLFGFQADCCILIINELTEFEYVEKNINCLKSLFDIEVIFLIYSSLYKYSDKKNTLQYIPNIELVRKISDNHFFKLQNELSNKLNLNLYDIYDDKQSCKIYNGIIELTDDS